MTTETMYGRITNATEEEIQNKVANIVGQVSPHKLAAVLEEMEKKIKRLQHRGLQDPAEPMSKCGDGIIPDEYGRVTCQHTEFWLDRLVKKEHDTRTQAIDECIEVVKAYQQDIKLPLNYLIQALQALKK